MGVGGRKVRDGKKSEEGDRGNDGKESLDREGVKMKRGFGKEKWVRY